MKLPLFPESEKLWDAYGRFYYDIPYTPFTQFDDGSLICSHIRCKDRVEYQDLHLMITLAYDSSCPALRTKAGQPIAKAWFSRGTTLLIDLDTYRAVSLDNLLYEDMGIPDWVGKCSASAYYAPGACDAIAPPITYAEPIKVEYAVAEHAREIALAAKAWAKLCGGKLSLCESLGLKTTPLHLADVATLGDLDESSRLYIARYGVVRPTRDVSVSELWVDHRRKAVRE